MITYGSTTLTSYNSIVKTEVYYYKSTSATSLSGGSWATTKPTWENGKYIWQKIRTVYEDGTHSESDPVNITGQQGATGTAAYSFKLNSSDSIIGKTKDGEYTIKKITFSATYKQGTGAVSAYSGRFKIESTTNGSTWKTEYTSSRNESSKEFTIPDDIILIKCSLYQSDGTTVLLDIVTVPVVKDGVDAIGLRDSIPYYLASDKDTGITRLTQGWTRYRPQLTAEKKYLWVYYVSRYSEGTTEPELIEIKDDLVHFVNNGDESPVESCVIDIEPVQDLHGYDSPWPAGGGVNLFDIDNINTVASGYGLTTSIDGDVVRISGIYTGTGSSSHRIIRHDQPIIENAKFVVFRLDTSSIRISCRYASTSDNSIVVDIGNATPNADVDVRFRFMIYTGSTAPTSYSLYSNICPITGWTGAKVTRTGKNLWKFDASYSPKNYIVLVNKQPLYLPVGTYTFSAIPNMLSDSIVLFGYHADGTKTEIARLLYSTSRQSASCTIAKPVVSAYFVSNKGGTISDIQLEVGSTATDYEPYQGTTYDITFPSKASTVYGGQLHVTTGELVVDRVIITMDGSQPIAESQYKRFYTPIPSAFTVDVSNQTTYEGVICDKFQSFSWGGLANASIGCAPVYGHGIAFKHPDMNTTDDWKTYFTNNPTVFSYELATPTIYRLTPQEITMLCNENNIFADTGQTAISYYDNQTSTDPYVDYSATSAFEYSAEALDKIDNLQIGSRNFAVKCPGEEWSTTHIIDGTNKVLYLFGNKADNTISIPNIPDIKVDDIIQVSFDIKFGSDWQATGTGTKQSNIQGNCNVGGTWTNINYSGGGGSQKTELETIMASDSKEGHINTWFKVTKSILDGTYSGICMSNIRFDYYLGTVSIRHVMVEKGTKPTDWTPAPEDVNASIATAQSTADTAMDRIIAAYGTCSTATSTAAKVVACPDFVLFNGARIQVTFTNANTTFAPTLNINNTGAKPIYINKTVTSSSNLLLWTAGSKMEFVYDGTGWIAQNVPYALYGTCSTGASTAAKAVTCNEAVICKGTTISVNMTNTNTAANATMNVGSTLAKDIYANGAKLTTNSRFNWRAKTTQKFVFDGQVWRMDDDSVKALATAYITEIDDDGIMVHPEDDSTSGWAISDAIQLFKNGISYIKLWIENNIPKIRIGKEDQGHIILDNDSVDIRNDNKVLASFGATSVIGDTNDWHQTIAANQITFAKGNDTITYISPDKLYTINAEVADAFYISNYSIRNASDGKLVIGLRR